MHTYKSCKVYVVVSKSQVFEFSDPDKLHHHPPMHLSSLPPHTYNLVLHGVVHRCRHILLRHTSPLLCCHGVAMEPPHVTSRARCDNSPRASASVDPRTLHINDRHLQILSTCRQQIDKYTTTRANCRSLRENRDSLHLNSLVLCFANVVKTPNLPTRRRLCVNVT